MYDYVQLLHWRHDVIILVNETLHWKTLKQLQTHFHEYGELITETLKIISFFYWILNGHYLIKKINSREISLNTWFAKTPYSQIKKNIWKRNNCISFDWVPREISRFFMFFLDYISRINATATVLLPPNFEDQHYHKVVSKFQKRHIDKVF